MKRRMAKMSKWLQALYLSLAIAALFPIASPARADSAQRLSRAETAKATQALIRWLECQGCGSGELQAVTRYGSSVVPSLAATLNGGLSPATRERLYRSLAARYDELDEQARKDPGFRLKSNKEEFIARYLESANTGYRIRAAQALAAIGGTDARKGLEAALGNAPTADVRTAIQRSLKEIK